MKTKLYDTATGAVPLQTHVPRVVLPGLEQTVRVWTAHEAENVLAELFLADRCPDPPVARAAIALIGRAFQAGFEHPVDLVEEGI